MRYLKDSLVQNHVSLKILGGRHWHGVEVHVIDMTSAWCWSGVTMAMGGADIGVTLKFM